MTVRSAVAPRSSLPLHAAVPRGSRPLAVWLVGSVLAAHAGAASLAAQQQPDTSRLSPVVVTATRVEGTQAAPTTTATVLEGDMLRDRGIRLVSDALREVPGLGVVRSGSAGGVTSVFLRGGESDYLQVLVDGVAINEPGGAIDLANLTTEDIDRIEVVRGPASVVYGSEAVSGVVQIFTRRGAGAPRLTLGARGGSRGTRELDASAGGQAGRATYTLSGAHSATDGTLAFNNRHRNTSVGGSVGTAPGALTAVRLTARLTDGRYHFPTSSGGEASDSNQFSFERRFSAGLDASRQVAPGITAMATLGTNSVDAGTDDAPDSPADTAGGYASRSTRASERHGADVRVNLAVSPASTLTAGVDVDWERERTTFRSEHGTFGPYEAPARDDRRWNRGYYGQVVGDIGRFASYTAGARLDENETFGTFFTWRAGGGLRLSPMTTLRASIGTAFKSPIFYEITGAGFAQPNEDVQPERSRSWDAGLEHALVIGHREVRIGATWFDQRFRDMIQYVPVAGDPFALGQYRNVAGARARGVELEARAAATARLTLVANATLLRTRALESRDGGELAFQEGRRLIRRPDVASTALATWRFAQSGTLGASVTHVGARDDVDFTTGTRVRLSSYNTVGASVALPVGGAGVVESFILRASAENLLDARYSPIAGFPGDGRRVMVGASAVIAGR